MLFCCIGCGFKYGCHYWNFKVFDIQFFFSEKFEKNKNNIICAEAAKVCQSWVEISLGIFTKAKVEFGGSMLKAPFLAYTKLSFANLTPFAWCYLVHDDLQCDQNVGKMIISKQLW